MHETPASAIQLIQPLSHFFRSPDLSESYTEDGHYRLILAPQGLSLLNLNRLAMGALALSTQYYIFHDDPQLVRYMTPEMWLGTIMISLLSLWCFYTGINGMSESQYLEFREGEIHYHRDRLFWAHYQVLLLDGIASLQLRDTYFYRDRVLALDIPTLQNWEGKQLSFFEYASLANKRAAMRMIDAAVYGK
ncbi:MAG: hypothetical protein AAFQ87_14545 [Bacteroidota bacterium]